MNFKFSLRQLRGQLKINKKMFSLTRLCHRQSSITLRNYNVGFSDSGKLKFSSLWTRNFKNSILKDGCQAPKRRLNCSSIKSGLQKPLPIHIKLSIGLTVTGSLSWLQLSKVVFCQAQGKSRVSTLKELSGDEVKFDWKGFFRLLRPDIWRLIVAVLAALMVALLNIEIPRLLGSVVNIVARFVKGGDSTSSFTSEMRDPVLTLLNLYIFQSLFTFLYICLLSSVGERVAGQMRKDLFESIIKQDILFFDTHRTGEIVNRLTSDVQEFKSSFKMVISQGLRSVTQIAGCGISLYLISPQMAGGMMVVIPSIIVVGTLIGSLLRKLSREAQMQTAKATIVAEEAISNIRTVRAFASEGKEMDLYNREVNESNRLNELLGYGVGLFQGGTNLFLNGLVLGTLYLGGYLVSTNSATPGDLMSFLVATQTIQRSLAQLSLLFGQFVRGLSSGSRVFEYINQQPKMNLSGGITIPHHSLLGDVSFINVFFSYPARPDHVILRNLDLEIPAGKMVAIVGSSGAGKSTVAALLERFYDPEKGNVRIDGIDLKDLDPSWLRGHAIGYIGQEPVLFATSIRENIRYGCPTASDEEVEEAARAANAHDFITTFPHGYETVVGERGVTVSGGQKQRIAIARALIKKPSILILDEATSALDSESEKIVQETLDKVTKGKTVLVIAHRLSTIKDAHMIAVLQKGKVVEIGSHDRLVRLGGHYWNLIKVQHGETEENERGP
ncbi:hypothetical protein J437_LFUL012860 [Ladona fulva]|uniref:Mitochondrial potassium channel ATP-binding subunit n=1 Tax=Ladona fulva TaxID=123851 RepID=A0A8K0P6A1_LADFU|nr:hypothetical protein J437_LFUL012860 [Ladona fulva]